MDAAPTVLIIDDDRRLARNLRTYLKRFGYVVRVSGSGEKGVVEFARFKPGVVLLDLELPDLGGIEVLERILSIDNQAKVIMVSGLRNAGTAALAKNFGAYDYLFKPLPLKELRQLLDKARNE